MANAVSDGLSVVNLELERGERLLFRGLRFEAPQGSLVRLAGPNGSGKTSLLRVLTGLMRPDAGEVLWRGRPIAKLREDYCRDLVYIGHGNGVKDELAARENVAISARLGGLHPAREAIDEALSSVGLSEFLDCSAGELSQGQRRRVALARLFISREKPLWILDEPFVALDAASVANLSRAVAEHVRSGGIVVYVTHQECPVDVPESRRSTVDVSSFAPKRRKETGNA